MSGGVNLSVFNNKLDSQDTTEILLKATQPTSIISISYKLCQSIGFIGGGHLMALIEIPDFIYKLLK